MKTVLSALAFAALLCVGHSGSANAAGASGLAASQSQVSQEPQARAAERPHVQLAQGWYEPRPRWRDRDRGRRHWRERDRRHYRHYDRGPSFGIYVQPRIQPRYVEPRRVYRLTRAHYRWCDARYRSYRASDNTFQPYHGPRRQCISPYI
ncbi:BA14K family protein [Mesorhizobium sp. CAU 1741]|uniref:BA14K family protein n=1 Tax=Mesorhizobium sp. CAU 1741 TaxID=3140366 RepID=UPI00325B91E9